MAINRLPIMREEVLPFGHLRMRLGQTDCGSRFWSIWPDGPIGDTMARSLVSGFFDSPGQMADELEKIAATMRSFGEAKDQP